MKKEITKTLTILFAFIISFSTTFSAYLKNYPLELTQPDGTKINCFATGDEFYNFLHTEEGYVIKQAEDGFYCFAEKSDAHINPTNFRVLDNNPSDLKLQKWIMPDASIINDNIAQHNRIRDFALKAKGRQSPATQIAKSGKVNNLVIFVTFQEQSEFSDSFSKYDRLFNDENSVSMRHFYQNASYNQFDVETYFCPPSEENIVSIQFDKSRGYFSPHNSATNPAGYKSYNARYEREKELLDFVINEASNLFSDIDIDFDSDNDGCIDNIVFIIKGQPNGWSELLWPHRSWYYGKSRFKGKKVLDYNFMLSGLVDNSYYGLGTLCHEFFHSLGAPDLYRYYEDSSAPVGNWDLMANTHNPPQFMCNLLKYQFSDWVKELPEINSEGEYFLKPASSPDNNIYKLNLPNSESEFFVLEYRKKEGQYDISLPGSGLLVYRVNQKKWMQGNAGGPPDEIFLFRKDGSPNSNGNPNDANLCQESGKSSISDFTNPMLFFSDGSKTGVEIYDISNCGDIISFKISYSPRTVIVSPSNLSFNLALKPDIKWRKLSDDASYQIQISSDFEFNNIFIDETLSDTVFNIESNLEYSSNYHIRVRGNNSSNTSRWSEVCSFSTMPRNTRIISPANNSDEVPILATFVWESVVDNNIYQITISKDEDFENVYYKKNFILDSCFTISKPLELNTDYYCKVKYVTLTGFSQESEICKFTTRKSDLVITSQPNSTELCKFDSISLNISTAGVPAKYQWFFNDQIIENAEDSIFSIPSFSEINIGNYFCKAISIDESLSVQSDFIDISLIIPPESISIPSQIQAALGEKVEMQAEIDSFYIGNKNYSFQWLKNLVPLSNGKKYDGTNMHALTISELEEEDLDAEFSLVLITKCGDSAFSNASSFVLSVANDEQLNKEVFHISPNPANETLNISFSSENGQADILLYDYRGALIANLWKGFVESGLSKFQIHLKDINLNSDVYIIAIKNEGKFLTKKISIVK